MTEQLNTWNREIGKDYTDRNKIDLKALNKLYLKNYGITREAMNKDFLKGLNKESAILEVGAGSGLQMKLLHQMGYRDIVGIEPLEYARASSDIDILEGDIFNLPFDDDSFDLVFTSAVLIHIAPKDIVRAVNEIIRVSRCYIWGFEYYSPEYKEIVWHGKKNVLWKSDYAQIYTDTTRVELIKQTLYYYKNEPNTDAMFLLEKLW
jgi:pseudaminic acid biosynthesis-associated methylase